MTPPVAHGGTKRPALGFAEARVAAEAAEAVQQLQAARRVAEHSRDAGDCLDLLLMLGLTDVTPGTRSTSALPPHDHPVTFPEALGAFRSTEGVRR